jgi:hypothetical protein
MMKKIMESPELTLKQKVDEAVFKGSFIPRSLAEVPDFENDHEKAQKKSTEIENKNDKSDDVFYRSLTGLNKELSGGTQIPSGLTETETIEILNSYELYAEGTADISKSLNPLSQYLYAFQNNTQTQLVDV